MALWKDQTVKDSITPMADPNVLASEAIARPVDRPSPAAAPVPEPPRRPVERSAAGPVKESLIAADVTIEGKIEGAGHIRIAGRFKGDVKVDGHVTTEHDE